MAIELNLPDLPEVQLSLGPERAAQPRAPLAWHQALRDRLSSYLPLLLMLLLALATWWLVKHTPSALPASEERAPSHDPDYTMTAFSLERFAADGRLKVRLEGALMRHFPDTDRIEIEGVKVRAVGLDGRVTLAHAKRAISNGDGSEVQLLGDAEVTSGADASEPLVIRSEFLHAFLVTERVRSHLPVRVQRGATEMQAAGMEYDHGTRRLDLDGPMRAVFPPREAKK